MADRIAKTPIAGRRPLSPSLILLTVTSIFWASSYSYSAIFTPYLADLGASSIAIGIVISSYGLTQTILRLPAGILSDRLRNKKLFIILGVILSLISTSGLFLFQQIGLILVFRGLSGVSAAMWVHYTTLYLTYYPVESAAKAMGKINFTSNISQMLSMLAGSFLAQLWGWRYSFLLGMILAIPGLFLSLQVYEGHQDQTSLAEQTFGIRDIFQIGKNRALFWTSILGLLSQMVMFATTQGFVPQYASLLGANKAEIGMLGALTFLPRALAGLIGGSFLARYFKLRTLIVFGFLLSGGVNCLLPFIHDLPVLFISQFFSGMGSGFQLALLMAICTRTVAPGQKASAMGFFQAFYGIGIIVGPIIIGYLADLFSLETGFVVIGILSCLSAFLGFLVL